MGKPIDIKMTFWCGGCINIIEAFFGEGDEEDIVHCDCGRVWKVQRPIEVTSEVNQHERMGLD